MSETGTSPTILTVYGATGDLMRRKLAPALSHLHHRNLLPPLFKVVGFSRRDLSDEDFRRSLTETLSAHRHEGEEATGFLDKFGYQQGMFENPDDYGRLAQRLGGIEEEWKTCANKLFYLAVPPEHYDTIFTRLATSGLTRPCSPADGWAKILVEKPFGKTRGEAERLDRRLNELFKDEQIYRIDHYLAKEALQNIVMFRFANNLLEDVWSNKFIERIDIKLMETIGVERRGAFYDGLGALLDVGQNHLLQMLALTTMDHPVNLTPEMVRRKRREVLEKLVPPGPREIEADTARGQYREYKQEPGVSADSTTETYFKIKTSLDLPRWQGVPIFLESGKKMATPEKEISVVFRHPSPCLCPPGGHLRNSVHFRLEPEPGISIVFWSKKPGAKMALEKRMLDFKYSGKEATRAGLEEYTTLLTDAIAGDQTLFISSEESLAGWRFIEPIVSAWRAGAAPLHKYGPGANVSDLAGQVEKVAPGKSLGEREIGIIGLGKMGAGLAGSLMARDRRVVGFNRTPAVTRALEKDGLIGAYSVPELADRLKRPRVVWLMVPAGRPVDDVIFGPEGLVATLEPGDIIVDGGNSHYKDSDRRAAELKKHDLKFIDVGVSGGPAGARYGACLMVGGDRDTYDYLLPLFLALAVPGGVQFFEGPGAGHFVKMVHNGIEYGMMQAIAEGFTLLKRSDYDIDLTAAATIYNHRSVIESRLTGWLADAFKVHGEELEEISGVVGHTGEAAWTVEAGKELGVEENVINASLAFRIRSAENPSYTGKILTALRNQFGGHATGA